MLSGTQKTLPHRFVCLDRRGRNQRPSLYQRHFIAQQEPNLPILFCPESLVILVFSPVSKEWFVAPSGQLQSLIVHEKSGIFPSITCRTSGDNPFDIHRASRARETRIYR